MGTILKSVAAGLVAALGLAVAAGACGGSSDSGDRLEVVASFYPLRFVTERVGGTRVHVRDLTPAGAEPHDLELSARDLVRLRTADLVVYLAGFSPAVDQGIAVAAEGHAFDVTSAARLLGSGDATDRHFWLDPLRLADVGDAVAETLALADPTNAAEYRRGATALRAELVALDTTYRVALSRCRRTDLVTSHTAFGYLAVAYGFTQIGVTGLQADREPTPTELADVARFVTEHQVATIYTETLLSPATARTVADATGARVAVLDPIEGLTEEAGAGTAADYLSIMRANLDVLREGQQCP
jgi:zinc transport system substrate-binding protein